jgi:hypothetical protein
MIRDLVDEEGENRAVRTFLMQYGLPGLTVGAMAQHMNRSGWPYEYWPDFARQVDNAGQHLTKAGAQIWIRHLFSLEGSAPAAGTDQDARVLHLTHERDLALRANRDLAKDAERLDFMIAEECQIEEMMRRGDHALYRVRWPYSEEHQREWSKSGREAIDAAIVAGAHIKAGKPT